MASKHVFCVAIGTMAAIAGSLAVATAEEADGSRTVHHPSHRLLKSPHREIALGLEPLTERRLTIQRRPQTSDLGADEDIYRDGDVRYNSIRTFDPAPYADSGQQLPFGLDGIGGYGSDLGYGAGHDDALYNRGQ